MRDKYLQFQPKGICGISFFDDQDDNGSGSSDLLDHIVDQTGNLLNTALLRNANPVNTAILSNTPISTPYAQVGAANSQSVWLFVGLAILGIGAFAVIESR